MKKLGWIIGGASLIIIAIFLVFFMNYSGIQSIIQEKDITWNNHNWHVVISNGGKIERGGNSNIIFSYTPTEITTAGSASCCDNELRPTSSSITLTSSDYKLNNFKKIKIAGYESFSATGRRNGAYTGMSISITDGSKNIEVYRTEVNTPNSVAAVTVSNSASDVVITKSEFNPNQANVVDGLGNSRIVILDGLSTNDWNLIINFWIETGQFQQSASLNGHWSTIRVEIPECSIDPDCDDNNKNTVDFCFMEKCYHKEAPCYSDSECESYCSDDISYFNGKCSSGKCQYTQEQGCKSINWEVIIIGIISAVGLIVIIWLIIAKNKRKKRK